MSGTLRFVGSVDVHVQGECECNGCDDCGKFRGECERVGINEYEETLDDCFYRLCKECARALGVSK